MSRCRSFYVGFTPNDIIYDNKCGFMGVLNRITHKLDQNKLEIFNYSNPNSNL